MTWRWHAGALAAAAVALALLIGPLYLTVAGELPFGPHDWKQADCLAVGERFYQDHSWNILDPRVLSRFPVDGRVNFELPLAPWLAAAAARLSGGDRVAANLRLITLLMSLLGPLALYAVVWTRTRSFLASFTPLLFLVGSPVFAYYATGSLPDAPGLGLFLVGLAFLLGDGTAPSGRRQVFAIAAMTLAGLVKMSYAPYLLIPAVLLLWRRREPLAGARLLGLPAVPVVALAVSGVLLAAQVVMLRLREAAFAPTFCTAEPVPITSLAQLVGVVRVMRREWLADLFSPPQLLVLAAAVAVVLVRRIMRRPADDITVATAVSAMVAGTLFIVFGRQLAFHDYYAIALAGPLTGLLMVRFALVVWARRERTVSLARQIGLDLVLVAAGLASVVPLQSAFESRTTPWWRSQNEWLRDARRDLDACGERCEGPVAVLGSMPPNLALVYLDRRGYVLGLDLTSGRGAVKFDSFEEGVRFLDTHGVRVLVMRWQELRVLPLDGLRRDFVAVDQEGEGYVFLRRGG